MYISECGLALSYKRTERVRPRMSRTEGLRQKHGIGIVDAYWRKEFPDPAPMGTEWHLTAMSGNNGIYGYCMTRDLGNCVPGKVLEGLDVGKRGISTIFESILGTASMRWQLEI